MKKLRILTLCGVIAAVYTALTWATFPIAFSPLQFRISEALTVLPFFFPPAAAGLTVGCFLANLLSGYGVFDLLIGPAATLAASLLTAVAGVGFRRRAAKGEKQLRFYEPPAAAIPPIILNAVAVPCAAALAVPGENGFAAVWLAGVLPMLLSEAVPCLLLGIPFIYLLVRLDFFRFVYGEKSV